MISDPCARCGRQIQRDENGFCWHVADPQKGTDFETCSQDCADALLAGALPISWFDEPY